MVTVLEVGGVVMRVEEEEGVVATVGRVEVEVVGVEEAVGG